MACLDPAWPAYLTPQEDLALSLQRTGLIPSRTVSARQACFCMRNIAAQTEVH